MENHLYMVCFRMLKQKKTSTDCESIHTACATETEHPSLLQIIQLAGSSFQVLGSEAPDGLLPQLASNPNPIQYLQWNHFVWSTALHISSTRYPLPKIIPQKKQHFYGHHKWAVSLSFGLSLIYPYYPRGKTKHSYGKSPMVFWGNVYGPKWTFKWTIGSFLPFLESQTIKIQFLVIH